MQIEHAQAARMPQGRAVAHYVGMDAERDECAMRDPEIEGGGGAPRRFVVRLIARRQTSGRGMEAGVLPGKLRDEGVPVHQH